MGNFQEITTHRGFSIMVATEEHPMSWKIEAKVGVTEGEDFVLRLRPTAHSFSKLESAVFNALYALVEEAKQAIDESLVVA
jgi:hypothetical protein